jgi:prepilin-type N-terminal cleavage/methylation domain-containing protein
MTSRRRQGFTLIELLVVISIIGILVGLLLPAVNSAREAGRRTQCQNNMRNIGLGIIGYVNTKNVFPPAGEFCEDATTVVGNTPGTTPDPTTSVILSYLPGSTKPRGNPMYSWVVPILPYIDNQELFNQWTQFYTDAKGISSRELLDGFAKGTRRHSRGDGQRLKISSTTIGILGCPDDVPTRPIGNLSYVVNGGFHALACDPVRLGGLAIDGGGAPLRSPCLVPVLRPTSAPWASSRRWA